MNGDFTTLHIPFHFEGGVWPTYEESEERLCFWTSPTTIEWFKKKGYTLYVSTPDGESRPVLPSKAYQEAHHPWPYYDTNVYMGGDPEAEPLRAFNEIGKIAYAQDAYNRHVVIKIVPADTDEYRVLRFLSEQTTETLKENCVIPVLDFLPAQGHWFVVMPRWGTKVCFPIFKRLSEAVDIIHSMLKGLAFLHKNNIAHGDVGLNNLLINHFSDESNLYHNTVRKELRLDRQLSYALFDFDFSVMLPSNMDKSKFRLPYDRSFGTFNRSGDTEAGEYDYDPFAFDVGGMGVSLFRQYDSLIPLFHGLAPLFDMMTTWDISRRFTADQALEFYEACMSELSEDQLQVIISKQQFAHVGPDPWDTLPLDAKERWKIYKTLPKPWSRRLLRWITCRRWMCHIVPWTRWLCFQAFSAFNPRRVYGWLRISAAL